MFAPAAMYWVSQYGYAALFLAVFLESAGLPLPGETALVAAAFVAAHGGLSLPWVILTAAIAGIAGDNLGYYLGRRYGRGWVERRGRWVLLSPARLDRMDAFFARFGAPAVAIARFVAGVRVVAAFAAGVAHMRWRTFFAFNVIGAVLWAATAGAVGYALGRGYGQLSRVLGQAGFIVLLTIASAAFIVWVARRLRARWRYVLAGAPQRAVELGAATWESASGWVTRVGVHAFLALMLSAGATILFAKVAEDVAERESTTFDGVIRSWALGVRTPVFDRIFSAITELGSGVVLVPVSMLAAFLLWRARARLVTSALLLAPLAASGSVLVIKYLFHRVRPAGALRHMDVSYAFPSGHSTASSAVYAMLVYVLVRERLAPRWTIALAATLVLLIGLSRVYLDVHWATDVIGGWAVGLAIAAGCALLYEEARQRESGESAGPNQDDAVSSASERPSRAT